MPYTDFRAVLLAIVMAWVVVPTVSAQPTDLCADSTSLTPGTVYNFDIGFFDTSEVLPTCVTATGPDAWFMHTPAITGYLIVETCAVNSIVLSAHTGCPGSGGTQIACTTQFRVNSNHCGDAPPIIYSSYRVFVVPITAGIPVWIRIAADAVNTTTSGIVKVTETLPPPNDACASATTLVPGVQQTFDTAAATRTAGEGAFTCGVGPSPLGPDLWYKYTPAASGSATVKIINLLHHTAPVVSVHSSCTATSSYCARANYAANGYGSTYGAQVSFPVTSGVTYLIRVATGSDFTFPGTINLSYVAATPVNDTCAGATAIMLSGPSFSASIPYDTTAATISAGTPADPLFTTPCTLISPSSSIDIWYQYIPAANGTVIFSSCIGYPGAPQYWPVQLSTYSGCSGSNPNCGTDEVCVTPYPNGGGSLGWVSSPVTAGVPIYLRICGFGGSNGTGTLLATFQPAPANDACANATTVGVGTFPFSTFAGTQDRTASCNYSGTDNSADVWFRFVPAADGVAVINTCALTAEERLTTTLTAYTSCTGPELLGCDSAALEDFCFPTLNGLQVFGVQGVLRMQALAGQPILLRIASSATSSTGSGTSIRRGTRGNVTITNSPMDTRWFEGNTPRITPTPATPPQPDAGDQLSTANIVTGNGPVTRILTTLVTGDRVDLFKVRICDPANFSVKIDTSDPVMAQSAISGMLFLFNDEGKGVAFASQNNFSPIITNQFITAPGNYYIGLGTRLFMPVDDISSNDLSFVQAHSIWNYNYFTLGLERAPDGPVAANAFAGWSVAVTPDIYGEITQPKKFTLALTGTCFFCRADFDANGAVSIDDIFIFLNAWFTSNPRTDVDGNGSVTIDDIFIFLNIWFGGC